MEKLTKKIYNNPKAVFTKQESFQINLIYPFKFFRKNLLKIEIKQVMLIHFFQNQTDPVNRKMSIDIEELGNASSNSI